MLLTNIPERVLNVQEMGRLGHSDHVMILATVAVGGNAQTSVTTQQDWNRADWDSIRQEIAGVDWRSRLDTRSAEESWEIFRDTIHEAVARNIPMKKGETRIDQRGSQRISCVPSGGRNNCGRS